MAKTTNSLLTQAGTIEVSTAFTAVPLDEVSRPGTPNRWGRVTLNPAATTRSANASTLGVIPGISAMTRTAGPLPLRNTSRVLSPWVKVPRSKSDRSGSGIGPR